MNKESVMVAPSGGELKAIRMAVPMHDIMSIRNMNVPREEFEALILSRVNGRDNRMSAFISLATMDFYRGFRMWMVPMVKSAIMRTSGKSTIDALTEITHLTANKKFNEEYADLLRETIVTLEGEKVVDLIKSFNAFLAQNNFKNSEVMFLAFRIKYFKIDSD